MAGIVHSAPNLFFKRFFFFNKVQIFQNLNVKESANSEATVNRLCYNWKKINAL